MFIYLQNVHSARSACKTMNRKKKQGGESCLEWRRFRSQFWWLTVVLVSRQSAVVADVGPPSSFLCFGVLSSSLVFFRSPCKQCSCLSAAASWRCWWWRPGELILAGRRFFFLFSACFPSFALCFFLFCFSGCGDAAGSPQC